MGVVAETCDEVAVMYAGRVVEQGGRVEIFEHSRHPYTAGLLASIPSTARPRGAVATIEGWSLRCSIRRGLPLRAALPAPRQVDEAAGGAATRRIPPCAG